MGGGTFGRSFRTKLFRGLSPRGRGNQPRRRPFSFLKRSIPAWAGEPGVNPVCTLDVSGLSPRGRGNPEDTCPGRTEGRSIPAWAGEPHIPNHQLAYPRSIPAWAGEPERIDPAAKGREVYPRVGGGTFLPRSQDPKWNGLSPRGRGNRLGAPVHYVFHRSIPAWAGEPPSQSCQRFTLRVYPRVGGGTPPMGIYDSMSTGLSPRGRGNHGPTKPRKSKPRSIPAWAGEPAPQTTPCKRG